MLQAEPDAGQAPEAVNGEANTKPSDGDTPVEQSVAIQDMPQPNPNMMNSGAGGIPGMNWNGNGNFNGMNPFMANAMFNFPNQMGMYFHHCPIQTTAILTFSRHAHVDGPNGRKSGDVR